MQITPLSDIQTLFAMQVGRTPNQTALMFGEEHWSYRRLNERSNQIARELRNRGVGRESIVAILMDRSCEMIATLLAVLKAGGAYAPLDVLDPPARIQDLMASLHPHAVCCDAKYAGLAAGAPVVTVESISSDANSANLDSVCLPDALAYVMFTSGSTGTPKAVMVEHRSVVRLFRGSDLMPPDTGHVFLQLAPLAFDASTFEIWGALLNGSALAIMPAVRPSLAEIARAIREYGVTALWLTSGLFNAMVEQQIETLSQVRHLYSGGDVLSPVHVRKFLDAAGDGCILTNGYGPTENAVFTCAYVVPKDHPADAPVPIGKPVAHTTVYLLDGNGQPVETGEVGELYTGGAGVARGYLNNPELTAERFSDDPFAQILCARMYRSGDLARFRPDGVLEFLGRADRQIKLRGFRIELGEIETALQQHPGVLQAAAVARQGETGEKYLVAYFVADAEIDAAGLRAFLSAKLPPYMIPAQFVALKSLPLNANGKVDRRVLAEVEIESKPKQVAESELERFISETWSTALGISSPEADQAFFELGGSSLQLMRVHAELERKLERTIAIADLFRFPTIRSLAVFLSGNSGNLTDSQKPREISGNRSIAIIGMAGRFPGAKNVAEFWENLKNGVESISHFRDEELEAGAGPNAIKARSILEGVDMFDAAYFGITPKEAERIDPQHRVFLECSQEALDDAGYDPGRYRGAIGVFAGCSPNSYFLRHLCTDRKFIDDYTAGYQVANYATMLGTSPDYLSSRVSYKLNLTGPSITMGTACSTSLVAATQACESLLSGQCDMALAGGVSITLPQKRAYQYTEGGLASADGHCRPFDADAQGTVFGSGCAVVLLKRLEDAIADGDSIYAVIKGYGINNDGAAKAGFTAPSVAGQAQAIRKAHQVAGVDVSTITYVEAHGTATPLGDPIEIAALTEAFRDQTSANGFCAIGTAKGNVGHLDAASGVTGLIKTALSLKHAILPPLMHFQKPNPRIDFEKTPFYVNQELTEWKSVGPTPLRAGVSAFGIGGTNAHLVLEQAPALGPVMKQPIQPLPDGRGSEGVTEPRPSGSGPEVTARLFHDRSLVNDDAEVTHHVLLLSAKTPSALNEAGSRLAAYLSDENLADAVYTLQTGRSAFEHRRIVVCSNAREAREKLALPFNSTQVKNRLPVVFAFPGQGSQYAGMGRQLYRALPEFRKAFDECSSALGVDLNWTIDSAPLDKTNFAQPAIFATEYSLARQWMAWGIQPEAMIGHSVGEFVAACLAGVFSLQDGIRLVAERGRMMQELPGGAMLSVRASEEQLRPRLVSTDVAIAAVNSPTLCVASGPEQAIAWLESALTADGILHKRLRTSHAFHSPMVDPILGALAERVRAIPLHAPQLRYLSTLTGEWITDAEATNPDYFARHCRETVQFSAALRRLQGEGAWCVLEVGPGQSLTTLARQHDLQAVSSLSTPEQPELAGLMNALGGLWLTGNEADWSKVYAGQTRRRVSLPAYPFERKRFWIEAPQQHLHEQYSLSDERKPLMTAVSPSVSAPSRQSRLREELMALLEDLSGLDLSSTAGATFLEMGFDSLFLTQVTQTVESKYRVKVRFARLLDDLSTVEQLTAFLDTALPPDPEPVPPVAEPTAAAAVVPPASAIEQLIKEQLAAFAELTAKQFAMMQNAGVVAAVAAPVPEPAKVEPEPVEPETPKFDSFGPYKPIQKTAEHITAQQQEYIQAFIERYNRRTQESKRLTQKHRAHLADPRVAAGFRPQWKELVYPLSIERSAGSRLWDVDG
ncbi:MAG TPA: amino acid adenylation domain-containing protein, partial [Bryobacteraceae bacterium]|nr:amino acid adenylation domain-containing protein [Bryobacteraceae bacterium]